MMKKRPFLFSIALLTLFCLGGLFESCSEAKTNEANFKPVSGLKLPPGFELSIYADGVKNARAMALGNKGTLFVGSKGKGNVYALVDADGDQKAEKQFLIDNKLEMPSGLCFKDGSLYVGALNRILRYDNIEENLENPPDPVVVTDDLPDKTHHGWKFIDFGPDGKLYVPVGAPCNICEEDPDQFAVIMRMNADGTEKETFARGIRNTVGFCWHPETDEMWLTDNGRDWMGDDMPPCELNRAHQVNMHFGYPYCHGGTIADPKFGDKHSCSDFIAPALNFDAHVAPLGLTFYTGDMFPEQYKNQLFVAQHGSWNRSTKIGYQVVLVRMKDPKTVQSYEPFLAGFEQQGEVSGRPVDLLQMPDGALLMSDDYGDKIYRISYKQ